MDLHLRWLDIEKFHNYETVKESFTPSQKNCTTLKGYPSRPIPFRPMVPFVLCLADITCCTGTHDITLKMRAQFRSAWSDSIITNWIARILFSTNQEALFVLLLLLHTKNG